MKHLGIIGCGWLGLHLAKHFASTHHIQTTTTSIIKKETLLAQGFKATVVAFSDQELYHHATKWEYLNDLEAVIITVPFSKQAQQIELQNRFQNICKFIEGFKKPLFLMSSTGIYPDVNMEISEHTFTDERLHANLILVENLMKQQFTQTNILRLGGLMGDDRYLSKYKVSNTEQPVNHVHYQDVCLVIENMLAQNYVAKTYNVVAPLHPSKSAVMNYQKEILDNSNNNYQPPGRIIKADSLRDQLNYTFSNPDPRKFK